MDEYEVEMDRIFRETDFAAENHDLKERLWQRLQEKAARRQQEPLKNMCHCFLPYASGRFSGCLV